MKTHLLLIGFSCTGKTSVGREAFGEGTVLDSDDELLKWIGNKEGQRFDHVYEVFMRLGRDSALRQIEEAEKALVDTWSRDATRKIISLGPGFPLRDNWARLRAISHVVLFRRSPDKIYESLKGRRKEIFDSCPSAKEHDNWDIGVIVDKRRREFTQENAISKIRQLLNERERYYQDNDTEVDTNNRDDALQNLTLVQIRF
jgi:shikimate kinase